MSDLGTDWRVRGEPDPVDIHVGSRVKTRRILLGKSQEVVAARLGISFQQLQKYESGANRVSASRLFDLAHILMTPISYFFEEMSGGLALLDNGTGADTSSVPVLSSKLTLDLVRDFYKIPSAHQRKVVLDLVRAMASAVAEADTGAAAVTTVPVRKRAAKPVTKTEPPREKRRKSKKMKG